ncbi:MAG: 30S ribosomal protein S13 [bacterium]|nr:30S ribosomal protein S13 [bacterium]
MVRIAGVNIPDEKKVNISLTYVYGIGRTRSDEILKKANITSEKRAKELTQDEMARLREIIERDYSVEGSLRREITLNVKRLKDVSSYRGSRHARSLPLRGQRTKTNSRTRRGNKRVTMGSGRKKLDKK